MPDDAPDTVVDRMHGEFRSLMQFLEGSGEISLINAVNDNFRKSLLLCAASYFETIVGDCVVQFAEETSPNAHGLIANLVRNKALSRQYHSWFEWERNNANKFFSLFGEQFTKFMGRRIAEDPDLRIAILAFIEIGRERNRLVHQDFGSFALEKTAEEIYSLYKSARIFVGRLASFFRDFG